MFILHVRKSIFDIGLQAEKESYVRKLEAESNKVSELRLQMGIASENDKEPRERRHQLTDLQVLILSNSMI